MENKLCLILSLIYTTYINLLVTPQGKSSIYSHFCIQDSLHWALPFPLTERRARQPPDFQ